MSLINKIKIIYKGILGMKKQRILTIKEHPAIRKKSLLSNFHMPLFLL